LGSSGKSWGGRADEGEAEFEVLEVAEAVGLAFEDLDFVIEALEGPVEMGKRYQERMSSW